ncbi:protein kinase family protein [Streptosporangiaceae bacterium NEAU-GS5]|nr:protein kinase family protein [Streptosporangiaceae bacterium NEAU-GS5]
MSMSSVEPGTRLADRFRLEDRVSESGGVTLWKAIDEILARPVAVHTFNPGFDRVTEVVTAARAASRLTDPRLTQVFDAANEDGTAYVVSEWVTGESLEDLLESGPMEPERGAALVAEAAEAMAHAHDAGLGHLGLDPSRLIWTYGGTVKLLGVAVDAAIMGVRSDDPTDEDTRGLGLLLYAALTGHWAGEVECTLPPAPLDDGRLCTPRQVTAGVPGFLDAVTMRILDPRRGQEALTTPSAVAEALSDVPRPAPVPPATHPPAINLHSEAPDIFDPRPPRPAQRPAPQGPRQRPSAFNRALVTILVLLVMAAVGVGAWTLGRSLAGGTSATSPSASTSSAPSKSAKAQTITPASAAGFDPLGDNEERNELASHAVDGQPSTEWHTESYTSPEFGRLKDGVGLLLDLGKEMRLSQVTVDFGDQGGGGQAELRAGTSNEESALKAVGGAKEATGTVTFDASSAAPSRYVVIWFTKLPTYEGKYRGTIYDLTITSPQA